MADGASIDTSLMQRSLAQALESLHARIADIILGLEPGALDWRLGSGAPTMRELVIRAATEERRWIAQCVLGDLVEPACEPEPDTMPSNHPLHELGCAGQISQTVLATLTAKQWGESRQIDEIQTSVAGCVLHTLEFLSHTLGQLQLLATLWTAHRAETG